MKDLFSTDLLANVGVPDKDWEGVLGEIIDEDMRWSDEFLLDEAIGDRPTDEKSAADMEAVKERGRVLLEPIMRGDPTPGRNDGRDSL